MFLAFLKRVKCSSVGVSLTQLSGPPTKRRHRELKLLQSGSVFDRCDNKGMNRAENFSHMSHRGCYFLVAVITNITDVAHRTSSGFRCARQRYLHGEVGPLLVMQWRQRKEGRAVNKSSSRTLLNPLNVEVDKIHFFFNFTVFPLCDDLHWWHDSHNSKPFNNTSARSMYSLTGGWTQSAALQHRRTERRQQKKERERER